MNDDGQGRREKTDPFLAPPVWGGLSFRDSLSSAADQSVLTQFDETLTEDFYRFLVENNDKGGFFSKGDADRIADRHLYESLVMVGEIMSLENVSRETKILDVGSGPGLPGYLFACLKNPPYVTLLDSSRRRLSFVEEYHTKLNADQKAKLKGRVRFQYQRAEEAKGRYDIVVARALIPFPFNAILVRHLFTDTIALATGPLSVADEDEKLLSNYGLMIDRSCQLTKLEFLGGRHLLFLKRKAAGPLSPVSWKTIQKLRQGPA